MKRIAKRISTIVVLALTCLALCVFAAACTPEPPPEPPKAPVKVSDGIDFEIGVGDTKNIVVADHITANNNAVSTKSDSNNASAAVSEGLLTVTGVSEGTANVELACGEITIKFGVTVYVKFSVTVDGVATYVKKGGEFTLPAAPTVADNNKEFDYWLVGEEHKAPGDKITVNANTTVTSVTKNKAPVKVKDGEAISVTTKREIVISEYITVYGNEVTAQSANTEVVTVAIENGKAVITAVAAGETAVTVKCGTVEIEFAVTVAPATVSHTVTVEEEVVATVEEGGAYTLPAAIASPDADFRFAGWEIVGVDEVKQPGDTVTVDRDLVITAKFERKPVEKLKDGIAIGLKVDGKKTAEITVTDYINKHGSAAEIAAASQSEATATAALDGNTLTITAVGVGNTTVTLTCGDVTVTFTVNVSSAADGTPDFENGAISFDLYEHESGSYEFEITAIDGSNFTYAYTVTPDTGVSISGNTLTYTATETVSNLVLTVNVTATDATFGTKTTSFSVTVNVTDTTPFAKNSAVTDTDTHDVQDGIIIDLTGNIDNLASYIGTYKVNGEAVTDPTAYSVTGTFTEAATDVALSVEATFGTKTVTYTYNLKVMDSAVYRLNNGGFDNGLDGWTLSNAELGGVNTDATYWNEGIPFNNDGKFFNAYNAGAKESAIGTLTSSEFKIGGSGYITYKLGAAKNANVVYLDVIEKDSGNILARFFNNAFSDDVANTEVRGCTLVAYKADLSEYIGKTVYIRISDNAINDYGLFFCDSFVTYHVVAPTDGNVATPVAHPATIYDIYNGGFESDMAGWTVSGGEIGVISTGDACFTHWEDPHTYNKEGDKLFSFWTWDPNKTNDQGEVVGGEVNRENNLGTLTSNMFVLKAGKYVSFKLGGGKNRNVFIELVNAESGTIIAVFHNDNFTGGGLISYSYKVDELSQDVLCYFRVVDNATDDWGCFTADDFKVNLDAAPEGSNAATNHVTEYRSMVNGSFESGLDGWKMFGDLGGVVSAEKSEGWYQTNENTKDGDNLFTFYYEKEVEKEGQKVREYVNVESGTGIIRSSAFILEKNGIVSFRFGAAHNSEVYINLYTTGGRLLAQFRNNAYEQDTVMVQYYYQADNAEEITCYFEVVDNATGDYGCVVMDDFCVNLEEAPTGAVLGTAQTKAERFPPAPPEPQEPQEPQE